MQQNTVARVQCSFHVICTVKLVSKRGLADNHACSACRCIIACIQAGGCARLQLLLIALSLQMVC